MCYTLFRVCENEIAKNHMYSIDDVVTTFTFYFLPVEEKKTSISVL